MTKVDSSFIRFIIVGVINTLIGTSIMFIAYNVFEYSYWVSSFLNYFIGSLVSFFLNKFYTFKKTEKSLREVVLFIVNIGICYFLAYFVAQKAIAFVLSAQSDVLIDNVAMIVGMCLFVVLNYIGQRLIVFK